MKESIQALKDLLHDELLLYQSLIELIQREQILIQSFDSKSLIKTIGQKNVLNLKIQSQETRRAEVSVNLAGEIGCNPNDLNITKLLPHLDEKEQKELLALKADLLGVIEQSQAEANKLESQYKNTIGIFEDTMDFISKELSGQDRSASYGNKGLSNYSKASADSMIVSTKI